MAHAHGRRTRNSKSRAKPYTTHTHVKGARACITSQQHLRHVTLRTHKTDEHTMHNDVFIPRYRVAPEIQDGARTARKRKYAEERMTHEDAHAAPPVDATMIMDS